MELWQALVLGLVQGLTEFLPVSSSGHLLLTQYVLGDPLAGEEGLRRAFDVALHLGTLLALLVFFREDLWQLTKGWFRSIRHRAITSTEERLPWVILLGTIPAVVVGLTLKDPLTEIEQHPLIVASVLAGFSVTYLIAERMRGNGQMDRIGPLTAFLVGCAQALALFPGVSRSGSTIVAGMMLKLDRPTAARFSFLLSAPIVLAAELRELPGIADAADGDTQFQIAVVVGILAAAISGYASVAFLLRFLANNTLSWFAGWRVIAAAAFFVWYALS